MDPAAVHFSFEDQPVGRGPLHIESRFPFSASTLRKSDGVVVNIARGPVAGERSIQPLNRHAVGKVEDHATPSAIIIVESGRTCLAIDGKLVNIPDTVERRPGTAVAGRVPIAP